MEGGTLPCPDVLSQGASLEGRIGQDFGTGRRSLLGFKSLDTERFFWIVSLFTKSLPVVQSDSPGSPFPRGQNLS